MSASEKTKFDQNKYNSEYSKEHYEVLNVVVSKEKHMKERIKELAQSEGVSMSQWIIRAIERELEWYE